MSIISPLYDVVTAVIVFWHAVFGAAFGNDSGAAWALSIVFLTVSMRLLLFPLFVKQIRSQRAMQALAPKIKELQKRHKGDRETLNKETMALYKEHNANPVAGCLPLVLQLPIFYALFHVLSRIKPSSDGQFHAVAQLSQGQVQDAANATIFGAPIAAAFSSSQSLVDALNGSLTATKVLAVVMIVLMGLSTFITQRQMMARNTSTDPQQQRIQRIMLYVLPFSFAIFGFNFPLGVLLYWLTTNIWSMGQQFVVLRRMNPVVAGPAGTAVAKPTGGGSSARGMWSKRSRSSSEPVTPATPSPAPGDPGPSGGQAEPPRPAGAAEQAAPGAPVRATKGRQAGTRKNRKKRPGGRR